MADIDIRTAPTATVPCGTNPMRCDAASPAPRCASLGPPTRSTCCNLSGRFQQTAERLGFDRVVLEARGHHASEFRVTRAYEESVAPGTIVFRSRGNTDRLHEVVKFTWEMAPRDGGEIAGVGLEILMLGPDGHIVSDYQFIEG
ncbi:hypothetical protein ACWDZX_03325 [Streptomyces collinus]